MLEIVVCDDNAKILEYTAKLIEKCLIKKGIDGQIVLKATNAYIVEEFLKHKTANVFFIDIDLKSSDSGYTLAEKIREKNKNAYLIFVTGHLEYVFQTFKLKTFAFIAKPITEEIIEEWVIRVNNDHLLTLNVSEDDSFIMVKFSGNMYKIKEKDIVFVEKSGQKTIIHTKTSTINYTDTLESIEKILVHENFIRCHKSVIVNKNFISEVRLKEKTVIMETGHACNIGRTYRKALECL